MSLDQLESAILALPHTERRRLALWFHEHRDEFLNDLDDEPELTPDQQAEILRRRDLAVAHPELLEPWDGTVERVRQRLHELRRQKTASR